MFLIGIDEVRGVFSFISFCRCLSLLIFIDFNGHECCLLGAFYLCQAFFNTFCEVDLPYRFLGSFCSPLFAMAFQLFTALVEIMVQSERMCKVNKIRELSRRGVDGEARNATRLLQQELQKGLVRVEDVDRIATPRIQAILDGLQAASTKVDGHKLIDIGPMALQSLQVLLRHPNRHIKDSAKLAKRKWIYILDPSCSPRPMKRQRCQISSGQIPHKEYFTAMSSFRR